MEQVRKRSRKRDAILSCIRGTRCHPTADWVFRQLKDEYPDLSLGTVYRNITMFKESGEIRSIGVIDGLEHFDGDLTPHAHFICRCCRKITDIPNAALSPELLRTVISSGASVTGWSLQLEGICSRCSNA